MTSRDIDGFGIPKGGTLEIMSLKFESVICLFLKILWSIGKTCWDLLALVTYVNDEKLSFELMEAVDELYLELFLRYTFLGKSSGFKIQNLFKKILWRKISCTVSTKFIFISLWLYLTQQRTATITTITVSSTPHLWAVAHHWYPLMSPWSAAWPREGWDRPLPLCLHSPTRVGPAGSVSRPCTSRERPARSPGSPGI